MPVKFKKNVLFPYQDISLISGNNESWRPVPGFEGLYEVSSFGRVKSLKREVLLQRGGPKSIPERILRTQCRTKKNNSVGDYLYTLMVTLYIDGVPSWYSVGRLVYHAFIGHFDLSDKAIMISYKDGDGRNLHFENLFATNVSDLSNASYEKGRYVSKLRKPVSQFDTSGKLIAQYASMYEAGRANKIKERGISDAVTGGSNLYKGFVWQDGYAKRLRKGKLIQRIDAEVNEALQPQTKSNQVVIVSSANLSLENMEGERWKDFPQYEGLYKISNYGRIKALRKVSEGKVQKWYPECIKKLTEANKAKAGPDNKTTLTTTLCKAKKKKTMHVARFVYSLFVKPFDLNDLSLRVYYKDGNPHNLHFSNLVLKNAVYSITGK